MDSNSTRSSKTLAKKSKQAPKRQDGLRGKYTLDATITVQSLAVVCTVTPSPRHPP